jgi:molybdopterin/thiamine biosynthesis adenylyltransferase
MNNSAYFFHEQLHRSADVMQQVSKYLVTVCGAGALGANIIESLARQGFTNLRVIDRDRIEERNLSTQPYYLGDMGASKAKILANSMYRAIGIKLDARIDVLTAANAAKLLKDSALVIDAFDNSVSRQAIKDYCTGANVECLHAGLANGYAEVIWNENYRVPSASQDDICDYPLARNLVMLAVAVTCESIIKFITAGEKQSLTITLDDFVVKPFAF